MEATTTKHNVNWIVAEDVISNAVSDGNMLAFHDGLSIKKYNGKRSAELHKEECQGSRQRNKSRDTDQQKAQNAHDWGKEHSDLVAIGKRIASQQGEEYESSLHDDGDVNVNVKLSYKVKNGDLRERGYDDKIVGIAQLSKKLVYFVRELRSQIPQ